MLPYYQGINNRQTSIYSAMRKQQKKCSTQAETDGHCMSDAFYMRRLKPPRVAGWEWFYDNSNNTDDTRHCGADWQDSTMG
jgi:hypothetical protein